MHIIIGVVIVLVLLDSYIDGFSAVNNSWLFIIALVAVAAAMIIWAVVINSQKKVSTSDEEKKLKKAKEEDAKNKSLNLQALAKAKTAQQSAINQSIEEEKKKILILLMQSRAHQKAMEQLDILGQKDWNPNVIDYLIDKLENRRANTIMDALNLYDQEKRERDWQSQQLFLAELERQDRLRAENEALLRADELAFQQRQHNRKMESLREAELRELEKLNEKY